MNAVELAMTKVLPTGIKTLAEETPARKTEYNAPGIDAMLEAQAVMEYAEVGK